MITVTIIFKVYNPPLGYTLESYEMEIPDFREDWTETVEELGKFVEEKRQQIIEIYDDLQGENYIQVLFQWELEEMEKQHNDEFFKTLDADTIPSQTPKLGWTLCSDGLYRDLPY
jgi:hypothetical protein